MEETRRRITQAAVELHEVVGPLDTSISAIAERAGVQRLTVYHHFPDERSLFTACTEHYFDVHPAPDPREWARVRHPRARLELALRQLYRYWAETERMMASVLRDHEVAPDRVGGGVTAYIAQVKQVLSVGWGVRGRTRERLLAAIGHAVQFSTWRSLVREQSLSNEDALSLAMAVVDCSSKGRVDRDPTLRPTQG